MHRNPAGEEDQRFILNGEVGPEKKTDHIKQNKSRDLRKRLYWNFALEVYNDTYR